MYKVCMAFSPLNGYNRHLRFGFLASGGSLYLITTPLYVFVSSVSFPDRAKFGLSFSDFEFSFFVLSSLPHLAFAWSKDPLRLRLLLYLKCYFTNKLLCYKRTLAPYKTVSSHKIFESTLHLISTMNNGCSAIG